MKTTTNRAIETFLLIAFPLALFAGCAGDANTKPTSIEKTAQHDVVAMPVVESTIDAEPVVDSPIVLLIDILKAEREQAELDAKKMEAQAMTVSWQESTNVENTAIENSFVEENVMNVKLTELKQPPLHVINFAINATGIDENYLAVLEKHADFLLKNPRLILTVNGHADSRGSVEYNRQLSEERALNVYSILLSYGAPDMQLIVDAFGESSPLNDETTFSENRRVELEYSEEIVLSAVE